MTGTDISNLIKQLLLSSDISDVQRAKIEEAKGGSYEPPDPDKTLMEIADKFEAGLIEELISLYKLLPNEDRSTVSSITIEGTKISWNEHNRRMNEVPGYRKNSEKAYKEGRVVVNHHMKTTSKKYRDMTLEELKTKSTFTACWFNNDRLSKMSEIAFEKIWEKMLEDMQVDDVDASSPVEVVDWLNANPCYIGSLFYYIPTFIVYLKWLESVGHIDTESLKGASLDISEACARLSK